MITVDCIVSVLYDGGVILLYLSVGFYGPIDLAELVAGVGDGCNCECTVRSIHFSLAVSHIPPSGFIETWSTDSMRSDSSNGPVE